MAKNVILNNSTSNTHSRKQLIEWVNETLESDYKKIEEFCTGAAYCQLMNRLFPGSIPMKKIKFYTNIEYEFLENFILLQNSFINYAVNYTIPTDKLVKGRFYDNFMFLQWFKLFYDANIKETTYNAVQARYGKTIGLKPLRS